MIDDEISAIDRDTLARGPVVTTKRYLFFLLFSIPSQQLKFHTREGLVSWLPPMFGLFVNWSNIFYILTVECVYTFSTLIHWAEIFMLFFCWLFVCWFVIVVYWTFVWSTHRTGSMCRLDNNSQQQQHTREIVMKSSQFNILFDIEPAEVSSEQVILKKIE